MFKLIICTEKRFKQVVKQSVLEAYWVGHLDGYMKALKDSYFNSLQVRLQNVRLTRF